MKAGGGPQNMEIFIVFVVVVLFLLFGFFVFKFVKRDERYPGLDEDLTVSLSFGVDDESPRARKTRSLVRFSPSDPALEPINLSFTLGEPPDERTTAPGGTYGEEQDKYQLDLGRAQCSCRGWTKRKQYPVGDPRRLCHHLVRALRDRDLIRGNEEWAESVVEHRDGIPIRTWLARLETAPDVLVTQGDSDEWLNIFAHEKLSGERISEASGPIKRYGWSLAEGRWSYGENVPGARELRKILRGATT
jgi:hypothetical protein